MMTIAVIFLSKYPLHEHGAILRYQRSKSRNDNRIPTIVHFVVGQGDQENIRHRFTLSSPFMFINYLNVLAARRQIRPEKLYIHYYKEPNTFWWNQTKQDPDINATFVQTRLVDRIYNKSIDHHAHRGDIMRLEVLINYGGIYFDTDVLALRSFEPLLNVSDVIMAHQDDDKGTACNAVIIGKKNASFLLRVYDAYQSFDANCWDCHSVRLTGRLAAIYSNEIRVLPSINFFYPSFYQGNVFFHSNRYNFSSNYATHLWNKLLNHELRVLTPERILMGNFTLARMLLHAVGKDKIQSLQKLFNESLTP